MTTQASRENTLETLLPLFLTSDEQERISDLRPRSDGVKFLRGILFGTALCAPIWALIWRVFAHNF